MNKDTLLQVSQIVSHASCPDGIGAAMICTAAYVIGGMSPPSTYFVHHGTRKHEDIQARPRQLFVDMTPPKGRWEEWKGLSPIVLDHHESSMHIVQSLGGVYGSSDQSGTMLAFENVMLPLVGETFGDIDSWRHFAYLCMVRDTWKAASPDWLEACSLAHALLLYGQEWGISSAVTGKLPLEELMHVGHRMYEKILRQSKGVIRNSIRRDVAAGGRSLKVAFFNHADGGTMSDLANLVISEMPCDIVVGYFHTNEDDIFQCVVSVRTNGCASASELARSFGGGGHAKAAGFRVPGNILPRELMDVIVERIATQQQ